MRPAAAVAATAAVRRREGPGEGAGRWGGGRTGQGD